MAVKIIDVDSSDYKLELKEKDQAIKDFVNEISVLQTLKDSKAENINIIHAAFTFHSQLWIVSEYCPGGSVHTLMKANVKPGLEEKYIVAIARELAIALKHVHEAGIIHRDVKAANILITQNGQLQLCDFGVSGVLESNVAKRSTIIGTPYWMPPEMHNPGSIPNGYGTEIDCWAFGCTMYELATGLPPNARIAQNKLHMFLRKPPRLEEGDYSPALREFVSFCLTDRPEERPNADGILKHPFVFNSSKKYPTSILRQLIDDYTRWEQSGGQRASLFNAFGASAPTLLDPMIGDEDDWNFSTTDNFDDDFRNQSPPSGVVDYPVQKEIDLNKMPMNLSTATSLASSTTATKPLTPYEKAEEEARIIRGQKKMGRLFDLSTEGYSQEDENDQNDHPSSDLPFRNFSAGNAKNRETLIDLDIALDFSDLPQTDLADVPTIRAKQPSRFLQEDDDEEHHVQYQNNLTKRLTRDWKFPAPITLPAQDFQRPRTQDWTWATAEVQNVTHSADETLLSAPSSAAHQAPTNLAPAFRPILTRTATVPGGNFDDYLHPAAASGPTILAGSPDRSSLMNFDHEMSHISRPSTAAGSEHSSIATDYTTGNPFDLEESTLMLRQNSSHTAPFHLYSQSESSAAEFSDSESQLGFYGNGNYGSHINLRQQAHDSNLSSDSEVDRDRDRISRTPSVKASADTLRTAREADEFWEGTVQAGLQRQVRGIRVKRTLLKEPSGPAFTGGNWDAYDSETNPLSMRSGLDVRGVVVPNMEDAGFPLGRRLHSTSSARRRSRERPRRHEGSVNGTLRQGERAPWNNHHQHPPVVSFPEVRGPDPAALEEDADPEVVVQEVKRLVDDYLGGLRVVKGLLKGGAGAGNNGGLGGMYGNGNGYG